MYNRPRSGTLNANPGGQEEARPQPVPGSQGMGREADHSPELGAGGSQASGLCPEAPPGHPGCRATSGRDGVQTGGDPGHAKPDGFAGYKSSPTKGTKLTYGEKLRDVRWKRRRDELLRASSYTCCECTVPLTSGTMDLQVHHVVYIPGLDPWEYPDELMVVVCEHHHRERQAIEQAIYVKMGEHLAGLTIHGMQLLPIYAFHEDDPLLHYLPSWMSAFLDYSINQPDRVSIGCEKTSCPLREQIYLRLAEAGIKR